MSAYRTSSIGRSEIWSGLATISISKPFSFSALFSALEPPASDLDGSARKIPAILMADVHYPWATEGSAQIMRGLCAYLSDIVPVKCDGQSRRSCSAVELSFSSISRPAPFFGKLSKHRRAVSGVVILWRPTTSSALAQTRRIDRTIVIPILGQTSARYASVYLILVVTPPGIRLPHGQLPLRPRLSQSRLSHGPQREQRAPR